MRVLLDTNIVARLTQPNHRHHPTVTQAVEKPADGSSRTQLNVSVDAVGRFEQSVGVIGADFYVLSSDDSFPADPTTGKLAIIVGSAGCNEYLLNYDADWESRYLYLDCPSR